MPFVALIIVLFAWPAACAAATGDLVGRATARRTGRPVRSRSVSWARGVVWLGLTAAVAGTLAAVAGGGFGGGPDVWVPPLARLPDWCAYAATVLLIHSVATTAAVPLLIPAGGSAAARWATAAVAAAVCPAVAAAGVCLAGWVLLPYFPVC